MVSRLPKENVLLLRHLLALMHAFQSNAQENEMTSLYLSKCISASMLWQPGPPSSPEGHGVQRVSTEWMKKRGERKFVCFLLMSSGGCKI